MSRILSALFILLRRLLATLFVCGAILYFLAGTQEGLKLIWSAAATYVPDKISIGSAEGNLLSHVVIRDFAYRDSSLDVSIKSLDLRWEPWQLLRGRIHIRTVDAYGVTGQLKKTTASEAQSTSSVTSSDVLSWLARIRIDNAAIHNARINLIDGYAEIDGNLDDNWHLRWSVNVPELNQLLQDLHGKLVTAGTVDGLRGQPELNANLTLEQFSAPYFRIHSLTGSIHTQIKNHLSADTGKLQVKGLSIEDFRVPDFTIDTTSQFHKGIFRLKANAVLSPVNHVLAEFTLPEMNITTLTKQRFFASARVEVNDFSQFNILFADVPEVRAFTGQVTGSFRASGELLHPVIIGGLKAHNGSVLIPDWKLRLTNIDLKTTYHTGNKVNINGVFVAGEGKGTVKGTYGIEEDALPLLLKISGSDMQVIKTKEYQVKITPDIILSYHDNDLELGGKILVPFADIHPVDFSTTATLPSEVVIVNRKSEVPSVPTNVAMQLKVILGDNVKFNHRGLQAKVSGKVKISGVEGKPLIATGDLAIEKGSFQAYGHKLTIQQGRLIYTGNLLTNPGLNLLATKDVKMVGMSGGSQFQDSKEVKPVYAGSNDITVGVAVSGLLEKPRISLYSDVSGLSQGDILSLLLFGRPQSDKKGVSSAALMSAMSELYDNKKKNPVGKLRDKIGVDEISVGETEYINTKDLSMKNTTTVNVARNLGRNLSVNYSHGLFEDIQVFSLRYRINKHLVLQTETSSQENGGDLVYMMESND